MAAWPLKQPRGHHSLSQKQTEALPSSHFWVIPSSSLFTVQREMCSLALEAGHRILCIPYTVTFCFSCYFFSSVFFFSITAYMAEFWLAPSALSPVGWSFCDSLLPSLFGSLGNGFSARLWSSPPSICFRAVQDISFWELKVKQDAPSLLLKELCFLLELSGSLPFQEIMNCY